MTRDIPTFRSERVSQIPSMGIVQQSGTRAVAEGLSSRAQFFDQMGEYANQKANQFMERNQRLAAEQAVREGGLNPAELSDPITAADRIYREAALNTYTIKINDDIATNLQRFKQESQYNPEAYSKKANEYLKGVSSELAPELKNSVSKYAMATVRKDRFSLEMELRKKVRKENLELEKMKIAEYEAQYINATTEDERDDAEKGIQAIIMASTNYLSPELKQQRLKEAKKNIIKQSVYNNVADNSLDLEEAEAVYRENNIPLTVAEQQMLYNSYNLKRNFLKQQEAQSRAALEDRLDAQRDIVFEQFSLIDASPVSPKEKEKKKLQAINQYTNFLEKIGRHEDAQLTKIALTKHAYNMVIEPDGMESEIELDIEVGDYNLAQAKIAAYYGMGNMKTDTRNRLLQKLDVKTDTVLQNEQINVFLEQLANKYAQTYNTGKQPSFDFASLDAQMQKQYRKDMAFMNNIESRIISMNEEGKSIEEIKNIISQDVSQNYEPQQIMPSDPIVMKHINEPSGFVFGSIDPLSIEEIDELSEYKSLFKSEEGWTKDNWKERIRAMEEIIVYHNGNNKFIEYKEAKKEIIALEKYFTSIYGDGDG